MTPKTTQKKIQTKTTGYTNKEKAFLISQYYGFEGVDAPQIEKTDELSAKTLEKIHPGVTKAETYLPSTALYVSILRNYLNGTFTKETQPAIAYYETAGPKRGEKLVHLDVIGSSKSITEAMLIKSALAILKEYGYKNLSIEINSLGDKDSISRFSREIVTYFKKNLGAFPAAVRQLLVKDPFLFINEDHEKISELRESMPQVVSFLNDIARANFKEVLEFLECMNIPYRITNHLVGNRTYSNNTVFEIFDQPEGKPRETLAWGTRFNGLSKKAGLKRDVPAAGISILIKKPMEGKINAKDKAFTKTRFYFIQLGFEAKLKSLEIIDTLREAKIHVAQSLSKDKLSAQLTSAEAQDFPYLLIVGQKEAMDGTVLVRYKETRSQLAIPIANLVEYLKQLP